MARRRRRSRAATGVKARITAAQKSARRKNIAIARAARKRGGKEALAKQAYKKGYKLARKKGFDKYGAKNVGEKMAGKISPRFAKRKARRVKGAERAAGFSEREIRRSHITHFNYLKGQSLKGLMKTGGYGTGGIA